MKSLCDKMKNGFEGLEENATIMNKTVENLTGDSRKKHFEGLQQCHKDCWPSLRKFRGVRNLRELQQERFSLQIRYLKISSQDQTVYRIRC